MVYSFTRTHTLHVNDTNIYTYLELLHVIRTGCNRVLVQNLSSEDKFDLHENERVDGTHFYVNGFARRLIFIQKQMTSRKWPYRILNTSFTGIPFPKY